MERPLSCSGLMLGEEDANKVTLKSTTHGDARLLTRPVGRAVPR